MTSISLHDCIKNIDLKKYKLPVVLGRNEANEIVIKDLVDIKSLLIAGSTGSGKSMFIATLLSTFAIQNPSPHIRFIFLDPKEDGYVKLFSNFPKSTYTSDLSACFYDLVWCRREMLARFNELKTDKNRKYPYIVITITDLAYLMMEWKGSVEQILYELAQNGDKVGIHIVAYTSRPSSSVIPGLLKISFNGRIAFSLASETDSIRIIDEEGAEKLNGSGDMIFKSIKDGEKVHLQAPFISTEDIYTIVEDITGISPQYSIKHEQSSLKKNFSQLCQRAKLEIIKKQEVSLPKLQKLLKLGTLNTFEILEQLEKDNVISPIENGVRKVLIPND